MSKVWIWRRLCSMMSIVLKWHISRRIENGVCFLWSLVLKVYEAVTRVCVMLSFHNTHKWLWFPLFDNLFIKSFKRLPLLWHKIIPSLNLKIRVVLLCSSCRWMILSWFIRLKLLNLFWFKETIWSVVSKLPRCFIHTSKLSWELVHILRQETARCLIILLISVLRAILRSSFLSFFHFQLNH
jgi:hypothetical protein